MGIADEDEAITPARARSTTEEARQQAANQLQRDGFNVIRVKVGDKYHYEVSW